MKPTKEDPEREDRIIMEIVVDAYNESERAMGWFCYLENTLKFPFEAICIERRQISPLKPKQAVTVIGMADSEECTDGMLVLVEWNDDELAVPLEQLQPIDADKKTIEAVEVGSIGWRRGIGFKNSSYL